MKFFYSLFCSAPRKSFGSCLTLEADFIKKDFLPCRLIKGKLNGNCCKVFLDLMPFPCALSLDSIENQRDENRTKAKSPQTLTRNPFFHSMKSSFKLNFAR